MGHGWPGSSRILFRFGKLHRRLSSGRELAGFITRHEWTGPEAIGRRLADEGLAQANGVSRCSGQKKRKGVVSVASRRLCLTILDIYGAQVLATLGGMLRAAPGSVAR